jgi:hypothetical protein
MARQALQHPRHHAASDRALAQTRSVGFDAKPMSERISSRAHAERASGFARADRRSLRQSTWRPACSAWEQDGAGSTVDAKTEFNAAYALEPRVADLDYLETEERLRPELLEAADHLLWGQAEINARRRALPSGATK